MLMALERKIRAYVAVPAQVQPVAQGFGSEAPLIEEEAPDIVGDTAYSIQEDKIKTEDDNRFGLQHSEPNECGSAVATRAASNYLAR